MEDEREQSPQPEENNTANSTASTHASRMDQAGLRAAVRILRKWDLSESEVHQVLALGKAISSGTWRDLSCLSEAQRLRVSYVLNIHATLRSTFTNPENVYGFMSARNNNPPFNGRAPLCFILSEQADFELVFAGLNSAFRK